MIDCRIIFEDAGWRSLLPLVYWRSMGELRCGRRLLLEQHPASQPNGMSLWVRPALAAVTADRFPRATVNAAIPETAQRVLLVNARWLTDSGPEVAADRTMPATVGVCQGQLAYLWLTGQQAHGLNADKMLAAEAASADDWTRQLGRRVDAGGTMIDYPWDLVANNKQRMIVDWNAGDAGAGVGPDGDSGSGNGPAGERGAKIYPGVFLLDDDNIRIGAGTVIKPCTVLDAEDGPIWIGRNVHISPHCTIQGPVVICDNTLVQAGAVIREGTTIGPTCKVGGEIEDSIIWGYSNKQHDGFLGHAVLGSWINIAADSINSDLKNTYGPIRVPINGVEVDSGRMFVGLTMGDHSKSSINSSFATGTVVGFCSNVICNAFPPKFVPSFCWMTDAGGEQYDPQRGLAVAKIVMARRKMSMTAAEEALFLHNAGLCRQIEQAGLVNSVEA